MSNTTYFVDILLPLPLPQLFTYRVPRNWDSFLQVGKRVVVPFGKSKLYTGLIHSIHNRAPEKYEAKYLDAILDDFPIVSEQHLIFWKWIADYYMCTTGEVMNAALPGSFNLASETKILLSKDYREGIEELNDKEYIIMEALEVNHILTLNDVSRIVDQKTVYPLIKKMIDKGVVLVEEEVKSKYRPKKEVWVKLNEQYEEDKKAAFGEISRAPKQQDALLSFLHLCDQEKIKLVKRTDLERHSGVNTAIINQLITKEILIKQEIEIGRIQDRDEDPEGVKTLNEGQTEALSAIQESFKTKDICLLHGVTSSGKTEVYSHLIEETIAKGKQVLFLVPEIALTTQLIERLKITFGKKVGVYHSRFSSGERVEIWRSLVSDQLHDYQIVLGARSALFLPFQDIGLIIVDEEHETSFKQFDPAPRYHARDAAIVLAKQHGAKVLLGSATPSLESYYNAEQGKYGFVTMKKRYGDIQMPEILAEDLKKATRRKEMRSMFSQNLLDKIQLALSNKQQVILFQNRRGFVPVWKCNTCGWVPKCKSCDISLTYHKYSHQLKCHYCGYSIKPYRECQACGSKDLEMVGFGTEKIEEELKALLPKASIQRMDLDTTRRKTAYQEIISDFESGKVDILIGTQMVSKGLDFDNVSLVGILNADNMLNFPDFRAYERSFHLMLQVAGRAGRKNKRGEVLIQTYKPEHFIIQKVMAYDYEAMYRQEIIERKDFKYPPFYRLIQITLKSRNKEELDDAADVFAKFLKQELGPRFIGPEYPLVSRVRNFYLKTILVKLEQKASPKRAKELIHQAHDHFRESNKSKGIRVVFDVDVF